MSKHELISHDGKENTIRYGQQGREYSWEKETDMNQQKKDPHSVSRVMSIAGLAFLIIIYLVIYRPNMKQHDNIVKKYDLQNGIRFTYSYIPDMIMGDIQGLEVKAENVTASNICITYTNIRPAVFSVLSGISNETPDYIEYSSGRLNGKLDALLSAPTNIVLAPNRAILFSHSFKKTTIKKILHDEYFQYIVDINIGGYHSQAHFKGRLK